MENSKKWVNIICKIILTAVVLPLSFFASLFIGLIVYDEFIAYAMIAVLFAFFVPMIWCEKRKKVLIGWGIFFVITAVVRPNHVTINIANAFERIFPVDNAGFPPSHWG